MDHPASYQEAYRIIGTPRFGGILVVSDHASNRVPADIDLGIAPELMDQHIAVDIGVGAVGELMAHWPGIAAFQGNVSRLVCDFNRYPDSDGVVPLTSDGHAIPGNAGQRHARIERFFDPYHAALAQMLEDTPQALIVSLHSFTPALATCSKPRPWHVGVLYNKDDRAARITIAMLEAEGLVVGDQEPYSGVLLNATMNRHAEDDGRPYVGIEVRQDQIGDPAGQLRYAELLTRIANQVALKLGA
ncbi:N-formylglutamate amidohydrolase [Altererythrobacter sp. KTW20L]|uniref:N-formylglutamate amidohydrolase n=1 Tax=Altererythrobacter sp. KTW20L TaxID=2942210 RepID=UPI0020BDCF0E|nr:N-formylglutamate amidohydrolase [Altererythrobacter sp. KTW20L]MCL6251860.1 N-formylglutamate amidohydrolase [Altererythrobacter sp. KTW20L]